MSIIVGTPNNDFLSGTSNDDQISGRRGNDTISGGLGNDVIDGGGGNDKLAGDGGNDTFKGSRGNDSIDGGDGIDTADYSNLSKNLTLSGVGTITKADGFGTDQIFKVETVIADASVANNTIDASQSLAGVSITADLQAQTISANNVPELGTLTFNVLNFVDVIGTDESDIIAGDDQNNQLFGNDGNDSIDGGLGDDTLIGGADDDTFKGSQGNDIIDGGDGIDTADYSELGTAITLSGVGTITKADEFGTDQIFKIETVIADASVANNTIDASQSLAGVSITADLQAQTISANNVPELGTLTFNVLNFVDVIGTDESDIIAGDDQNNQLFGNDGNDSIDGGQGNDILTGGFGADKFIFNSVNEGLDIIKDYNFAESDVIQVSTVGFGTTNISDFSYDASSGNLSFLGNQFALLENLSPNSSIQLF